VKPLSQYNNPFNAIDDFEEAIAKYTGAPFAVATDCCTHAIELCLRYLKVDWEVGIPAYTYLSVPMIFHKLNIPYRLMDRTWHLKYRLVNTPIWDCARLFEENMYCEGQYECLSFGYGKPFELGRGGAILTDNEEAYKWLKLAAYDGRDLSITPWQAQKEFTVGYHYRMTPEECIIGAARLTRGDIKPSSMVEYPDLRKITINAG
jgi:dTDP-4-amino-4,6-dideoxygalactose transaminase